MSKKTLWPDNVQAWMKQIAGCNTHRMKLRKGKACLLVIDMQNEFLREDGAAFFHYGAEILPTVTRIVVASRRASIPVVFTGHAHEDPRVDGGMTAEFWPDIKRGKSLIKGTRGVAVSRAVKPLAGEKVVWKHRYSAFYNTDLETVLRGLGVTDLIITGVLTNVCCESTARDAFFRDFRVFFVADATATTEPEFHIASLKNLAYAFAWVLTTRDLLAQIRG